MEREANIKVKISDKKETEQVDIKAEADIAPSETFSSRKSFNTTEQVNYRKEIEKINLEREANIKVEIDNKKEIEQADIKAEVDISHYMNIKEHLQNETEVGETMNSYSSTFRVWLGILMALITSLTTRLNSTNFPQISLNQDYSTINGKSSFDNNTRRPASKNVANDMRKSEMVRGSTTPIPKSEITMSNLKFENVMREPKDIFDSFPKNIVSNNSTEEHKVYNSYNSNKQLLMKVDLPRPQHNSEALREIKHTSRKFNTENNLYQANTSGLMLRTMLQGKYNRRQYFFKSRPNYFFRIIRQAVLCRTSS